MLKISLFSQGYNGEQALSSTEDLTRDQAEWSIKEGSGLLTTKLKSNRTSGLTWLLQRHGERRENARSGKLKIILYGWAYNKWI